MELESGFYVVEAQKEGYVTGTRKIAIKPAQENTLSLTLSPQPAPAPAPEPEPAQPQKPDGDAQEPSAGEQQSAQPVPQPGKERLFVEVLPPDAEVRVLNIGPKFEQGMELGPGKYEVEVKKQGLGKKVETIEVTAGQDTHATIELTGTKEQSSPSTGILKIENQPVQPGNHH